MIKTYESNNRATQQFSFEPKIRHYTYHFNTPARYFSLSLSSSYLENIYWMLKLNLGEESKLLHASSFNGLTVYSLFAIV